LDGASPGSLDPKPFEVRLDRNASLREALDTIITSRTRVAPVFDGDRFVGTITAEGISRELAK
jgi:predicted transcriptional regulator